MLLRGGDSSQKKARDDRSKRTHAARLPPASVIDNLPHNSRLSSDGDQLYEVPHDLAAAVVEPRGPRLSVARSARSQSEPGVPGATRSTRTEEARIAAEIHIDVDGLRRGVLVGTFELVG
jgi:hypothetical protein